MPTIPRSPATLDLVALATIADVVPLVDENRALATAGLRGLSRTQKPGLRALMRVARRRPGDGRRDRRRLPARAADQRGRTARAARRRARARAHRGRARGRPRWPTSSRRSTATARPSRTGSSARPSRPSTPGRPSSAAAARYVVVGRGLARGRDRHRRLAARRAVRPARRPDRRRRRPLEGLGPFGAELRPPRAASPPAPTSSSDSAATAPRPASRSGPTSSRRSRRRSPRTPTPSSCDDDLAPVTRVDAVVPAAALTLELARELERLAPFGLGNPDVTLLVAGCEAVSASTVGEGKHLRFRVRQHGRDAGSAIAFGLGAQLDRLQAGSLFDVAFRLKQNRWNGTVAPQLVVRRVFDTRGRATRSCATWLAGLWRAGEAAWTPEARRIFAELGLDAAGGQAAAARVRDVPGAPCARRAAHAAAGRVGGAAPQRSARAASGGAVATPGRAAASLARSCRACAPARRASGARDGARCTCASGPMALVSSASRRRDPVTRRGTSSTETMASSTRNVIRTTSSTS